MPSYYEWLLCKGIMQGSADILIEGLEQIALLVGHSPDTVRRWHRAHGFPIYRLPDGRYATTRSMIDAWIFDRYRKERAMSAP